MSDEFKEESFEELIDLLITAAKFYVIQGHISRLEDIRAAILARDNEKDKKIFELATAQLLLQKAHEKQRQDIEEKIAAIDRMALQAMEDAATISNLRGLLDEGINEPNFDNMKDWEFWRNDYRDRVKALASTPRGQDE